MEKIYSVFEHMTDPNYRLGRKQYLLTILIYNVIIHFFVGIITNGFEMITRNYNLMHDWNVAAVMVFVLSLPLYSSHYHRLMDTGMVQRFAILVPAIGFGLKFISVLLPSFTDYYTSGFFGSGTLAAFSGLYMPYYQDKQFYTLIAIFSLLQAIYIFINLILILTKTDQFTKKEPLD